MRNVFLYKIWFFCIREYRGDYVRLPCVDDHFYFDGYPRSGNTFFANLVGKVYPDKRFAHHLHVISGLKIALNFGLPTFVIIREPKDSVASNLYRIVVENKRKTPNPKRIERLLISYYNYYSFVKEHIDDINVVRFDLCVNNELLLIHLIAETVGFEVRSDNSLKETLNDYRAMMKKTEAQKDTQASSLPNNQRMNFKKEYLSNVLNSPSYSMAEDLYNEIASLDLFKKN